MPPEAIAAQGLTHWPSRRPVKWLRRTTRIKVSHNSISRLWRGPACSRPGRGGQVLHRPAVGGEGPRHGDPLPSPSTAYPGVRLYVVCDNYATHKLTEGPGLAGEEPTGHPAPQLDRMLLDQLAECFFAVIPGSRSAATPSPQSAISLTPSAPSSRPARPCPPVRLDQGR